MENMFFLLTLNNNCAILVHRSLGRAQEVFAFIIGSNVISVSKTRLVEEIAKCDVLCANCHAKTHYDIKNHSPIV